MFLIRNSTAIRMLFGQINFLRPINQNQENNNNIQQISPNELSAEDIINFDIFYKSFTKTVVVRQNGQKKIIQRILTPNIMNILKQKLGYNSFQINRFIHYRKDAIKEEELVFCLKGLIYENQANAFIGIQQHFNYLIENQKLKFTHPSTILGIFECDHELKFLSLDSQRHLIKQMNEIGVAIKSEIQEDEIEQLAKAFIYAAQIDYNQTLSNTALIRIRKIIQKHFKMLTFETIIQYFDIITQYREKLLIELTNIVDLEEFFTENYNVLTLQNKLTILKQLSKIKYSQESEVIQKFIFEYSKGLKLTIKDLTIFSKSLTLFKYNDPQIWNMIENNLIELINSLDVEQFIGEITLVVQSIQQSNGLSIDGLQIILSKFEPILIDDCYTLKFLLMYELSLTGSHSPELFKEILIYEQNNFQFKYISKYNQNKIFELLRVFLFNFIQSPDPVLKLLLTKFIETINTLTLKTDFKNCYQLLLITHISLNLLKQLNLETKNLPKQIDKHYQEMIKKIDRKISKNAFTIYEGLKLIGSIDYYQIEYKQQAYRELERIIVARLEEIEDLNILFDLIVLYKVESKIVLDQFVLLVINNIQLLELDQLQNISSYLKSLKFENQNLDLMIIEKSLRQSELFGIQTINYPDNYDCIFLFK